MSKEASSCVKRGLLCPEGPGGGRAGNYRNITRPQRGQGGYRQQVTGRLQPLVLLPDVTLSVCLDGLF